MPRGPLLTAAILGIVTLPLFLCAEGGDLRAEGGEPRMPGPARTPLREGAAAENTRCEGCHEEIAAEWRGSLHKKAHVDPAYQRALAIEPLPFCRGCHAPEANPDRDPPAELGAIGVGCISCHAVGGATLAAPREDAPAAPHGVVRTAAFAGPGACAACHEFSFPDSDRRDHLELMQSTHAEHRASPFASVACAACHMPLVVGRGGRTHKSHTFPASRDPSVVRSAVRVSATRGEDNTIEVRITPRGVGHSFPTGDLFRRLEIRAEAVGAESNVVAEDVRYLARRFGNAPGRGGRAIKVMLADTRVSAAEERVITLSLGPKANGLPVAWRVAYQRVGHPIDDENDAALVEGEVEIAAGLLP